jgi:hypothetical protein
MFHQCSICYQRFPSGLYGNVPPHSVVIMSGGREQGRRFCPGSGKAGVPDKVTQS